MQPADKCNRQIGATGRFDNQQAGATVRQLFYMEQLFAWSKKSCMEQNVGSPPPPHAAGDNYAYGFVSALRQRRARNLDEVVPPGT